MMPIKASFQQFSQETLYILDSAAHGKGYAVNGDGREVLDFVDQHFKGHAAGEVIYKVIRWMKKKDPTDLIKIAAWAFLMWDQEYRSKRKEAVSDVAWSPTTKGEGERAAEGIAYQTRPGPSLREKMTSAQEAAAGKDTPSMDRLLGMMAGMRFTSDDVVRIMHSIFTGML